MELIGDLEAKELSENELSCTWNFPKVTFYKSYRSHQINISPYENISGFQLAIIPYDLQHAVKFFLFMYGCEERGGSKITFSVFFKNKIAPKFNLIRSDVCIDLKPSMKIFEIHSSHPMLFNCIEYTFQLHLKLHRHLPLTPSLSNTNTSIPDLKEGKITRCFEYPKQVTQELESLFISGHMCGLKICIGEEVLHAHKLILCARSPVFKKMMEHDCLESESKSITITDCPAPSFKKFLKYLYTGEIEVDTVDTVMSVMSLYSLGDKYDVTLLQESCSNILQSRFTSESVDDLADVVCEVLQLAECHGDLKLKSLAVDFMVNHFPAISCKQSWKDLIKSNGELTSEVLALVATGLHKKNYKTGTT